MCPSDANGVYSLPSGYTAITGETIQASQHNPPLEDLESAMSARLMRSGVAPMTGPLKIVDGSVGSPGLKFNTDGTVGFYKTTDGIGVSVGGTQVAEFTANGISRMIGELIPWTRLSAPDGWVLAYGQTLSRTTYADLWGIAQTEIAAGNTFYNNGNGTTTFGIGDLRGRVVAGKDDMGGSASGLLTSITTLGGTAGSETKTLLQANLPAISPTFTGAAGSVTVDSNTSGVLVGATVVSFLAGGGNTITTINGSVTAPQQLRSTGSFTPSGTISALGSGSSFNNLQPTMACNYILYAGA